MAFQENYVHAKFGIDEIYVHERFALDLLEKLQRRAAFSLDAEDAVVHTHATHDFILIFHKQIPNRSLIYRFLKFLNQDVHKEEFIKSNTLMNEEELYLAIKNKTFVLVTPATVVKETYIPG